MKALGAGLGSFAFRDVEVVRDDDSGAPSLALHGTAAALADERGVARVAGVAHPHRHHGDGRRARARLTQRVEPVLTPEAMAGADARTIAAGTPLEVLMERAGRAVAWAVRRALPGTYGRRVVVGVREGQQRRRRARRGAGARGMGCPHDRVRARRRHRRAPRSTRALASADVVVDAMYGTGLRDALRDDAAWVAEQLTDWPGEVVAVDIPSGVDGLTGAVPGRAVRATRTVTFAARKPGLVFEPGRSYAGEVVVADIGIEIDERR